MFSKEMEALIEATLQDGVLTDQEKAVLVKRAQKEGIDVDELDVYIQSLLQKRHQAQAEADAVEDRKSKVGDVKKCPICGGIIEPGFVVCPHCGNALNVNEVSTTLESLSKKLLEADKTLQYNLEHVRGVFKDDRRNDLKIETCAQKVTIITSTVPKNDRADLLEVLAFSKSKADKNAPKKGCKKSVDMFSSEDLGYAYWCLFETCVNLAQANFKSDPAFNVFFDYYEKENAKQGFFEKIFGGIFGKK